MSVFKKSYILQVRALFAFKKPKGYMLSTIELCIAQKDKIVFDIMSQIPCIQGTSLLELIEFFFFLEYSCMFRIYA